MSKNLIWKLGLSTDSKNVKQADPAPESDNQPSIFRSRINVCGPQKESQVAKTGQLRQSLSSPGNIFTAQRNKNSSSPIASATKKVDFRNQRQPGKQNRHPHLKIENLSEIGAGQMELKKTDQNKHQVPDQRRDEKDPAKIWEEVVGKQKTPEQKSQGKELRKNVEQVVVEKHKVPLEEKPKKNGEERVTVQKESVKAGFINNFSLTLTWEEIVDDFLLMTGKRPPRNPKKNPFKDDWYPGNRLHEVCAAIYKIEGEAAFRKNQREQ